MDVANPSSSKPEPFRTSYNTTHITPLLPNPTTFNPFDPIFNFDFLPSWTPTFGPKGEPCTLEVPMVPDLTHMFDSMTFSDEPPFDFYPSLPLPPMTPSKKAVRKRRPKRAPLGLRYTTFQQRLDTLTGDLYVLAIDPLSTRQQKAPNSPHPKLGHSQAEMQGSKSPSSQSHICDV